jgi:predicted nucleic acid-binding protein
MILVDTSIWIDHLREGDPSLMVLLRSNRVVTHDHVIGEIALGTLHKRNVILDSLDNLPKLPMATDPEVRHLIESEKLFGRGIGYVDAHLIAAVKLAPGTMLWTRDKRFKTILDGLGLSAQFQ